MIRDIKTTDRGIAFALFGLLLSCYLFTYTGIIQSSDGLAMFATAESIVRRHEADSNQLLWMDIQQGSYGLDGELYSRKGLGMILLALPLVWLARQIPAIGLVHGALLLNPLLTAWTGALLYRMGRRLGWRNRTAMATALIFGLATLAWPYTQTFFSDPICGWGLLGALYGLLSYSQSGRKRYLAGSALAWSVAYLARTVNLVTLPIFAVAFLLALRQYHGDRNRVNYRDWSAWGRMLAQQWRPLITFAVPIILAGLLSLWWNWLRYGSVWESGYVESESFSAPWLFGITGLLVGPARGMIWYSPVLLLGIGGIGWFRRQARWILATIGVLTLLYVLLYGKWYMWHGGFSWGPRFLVPLLPLLALLIGPAWQELHQPHALRGWGRLLLYSLIALSVGVQWLGMLVPFGLVQNWLAATVEPLFAPETFTQWRYSPLVRQWEYLQAANLQLAWWRATQTAGKIDWQGILLPLVGVVISFSALVGYARSRGELFSRLYGWLHGFVLCAIVFALLINYQMALTNSDQHAAADRIERLEQAGDAVLYLRPTQTQNFANVYHGRLPVYGFTSEETLDARNSAWLQKLTTQYRRLWVISDDRPPNQSGWERPLRVDHFLLQENRLPNTDNARLATYAIAGKEDVRESGIGLIFGDPAGAERVTATNGWIQLNGYDITAETHPGDSIVLALRWQSLRTVAADYHVFVHLLDPRGVKVEQRDGQPVQWMRPISTWRPGEGEVLDHYGFLLAKDAVPGDYRIAVGLYDPVSGQRLPISAGPGDFAIELGPITVTNKP
ncbi:MAG: hypothetical protein R3C14_07030 [Caldilineaceae bacterium]